MLCYVMLCYVMLCYVMLCYVMLCYVMLCYGLIKSKEFLAGARFSRPGKLSGPVSPRKRFWGPFPESPGNFSGP